MHNKTRVTVKNADQFSIEIFNLLGQRLKSADAEKTNSVEVDFSGFPAGVYVLRCSVLNEISTLKIVREKD